MAYLALFYAKYLHAKNGSGSRKPPMEMRKIVAAKRGRSAKGIREQGKSKSRDCDKTKTKLAHFRRSRRILHGDPWTVTGDPYRVNVRFSMDALFVLYKYVHSQENQVGDRWKESEWEREKE